MSLLFIVENKTVKPNPETLLIEPFKSIWARDTTREKVFAIEEFTYIEFVTSMKKSNPYHGYSESIKRQKVKADIITKAGWEEDQLIKNAIKKVEEFQTEGSTTYRYFMSAKVAAEQMENFFTNFDITEANLKTGNPLYKPKDITSALIDTYKVLENLTALKEKVDQELFEFTKTKAQKEISYFAQ